MSGVSWALIPKTPFDGSPFDGGTILVPDERFYAITVRWDHVNRGFADHHGQMISYPAVYMALGRREQATKTKVA